jgi:hypothetical protein
MNAMRSLLRLCALFAIIVACSSEADDAGSGSGPESGRDPDADRTPTGGGQEDAAPARPYKHYDVNHVLSTGQSDSVANGAEPEITTTQPFGNLSFDVGVMTAKTCDSEGCRLYDAPKDFVPLVEGDRYYTYGVETMSAGLANQATAFATAWLAKAGLPAKHDILVSLHGRSGNTYWCLRKNECNYITGYVPAFVDAMKQVDDAKRIAESKGKTYVVRAVTAIHGASDHYNREQELSFIDRNDGMGVVGNYAEALMEWQRDYEAEIKKRTGQAEPIPLFVSQFGSWTDVPVSAIPVRQLEAHVRAPGKVIVVTPNYPFKHDPTDCLHYTNYSERRLGAYFAKVYQKVVVEGGTWEPVRPIKVERAGKVITITYTVPVPPLVFDETRVTNPGNSGFTYEDDAGSAAIASVALAGPDKVTVTLTAEPTGSNKKLRYALNAPTIDPCPGPERGARGNLRDSDTTQGYHHDEADKPYELFNWAVHSESVVP